MEHPIILFDGICNFCNGWVNYIIKRDTNSFFKFAALQSKEGKKLLQEYQLSSEDINSVIVIFQQKVFIKSDAALFIAKHISGVVYIFSFFTFLPLSFRNSIYDYIAKNRYTWFGKKETCMIPTPAVKSRFLD